ncbi:hypothetical protein ABPG72_000658 [Tetrahymena utriculariae]
MIEGSDLKSQDFNQSALNLQTQNQIVSVNDTQENISMLKYQTIQNNDQLQNVEDIARLQQNNISKHAFNIENHEEIYKIAMIKDESDIKSINLDDDSIKQYKKPQALTSSKKINVSDSKDKNYKQRENSILSFFKKKTITNQNIIESDDGGFSSQLWQHRAMKIIQKVIYFSSQMLQLSATVRFRLLKKKQLLILNDVTAVDINKDQMDKQKYPNTKNLIWSIKTPEISFKNQKDLMKSQMLIYLANQQKQSILNQLSNIFIRLMAKIPIISPNSHLKIIWDIFFMIFILFQIMTIPMILSYNLEILCYNNNEDICVEEFTSVILMAIDMLLCMNTAIFKQGTLINKRLEIIKNYKQQFIFDLVVLICYSISIIVGNDYLKLIILIKLYEITHIVMFLEEIFHPTQIIYSLIDIGKIIFIVIFMAHMVSCFIYIISKNQPVTGSTWITRLNYNSWVEYYITGLYFAIITMITIGYGDIVPVTIYEKIFVMGMTLVSCGVFAYSLNTISRIISEFSMRRSKFRKKMIHLNMHIESRGLNKQIAIKVRKYLEFFYKESEQEWENSEKDLQCIPQTLKEEVYQDIYGNLLKNSKFFNLNFSEKFLNQISLFMKEKKYGPEEVIYRPDEQGSTLYFIFKGVVELYLPVKNPSDSEHPVVSTLKKGDSFGVYSFFSGKCRETGAISKQVTSVVVLELRDFFQTIKEYEEDYEIFCMMKDKINLSNSTFGLDVKCKSCGKFNHQLYDCPLITYKPKKQLVIARSNRSEPQSRASCERRNMRNPNSLYIWKYIRSFDSGILKNGRQKSISSMTKLDEFVIEKKQSYSQRPNNKFQEGICEEDEEDNNDEEHEEDLNNSQKPFEEILFPKSLSNISNSVGVVATQNLQISSTKKMLSQQGGSNLVFCTQTPLSMAISNQQNNNSAIVYTLPNNANGSNQENILTQNSCNIGINQPNSPSKLKRIADREEAIKCFQNKKSSGQMVSKQLDELSQQMKDNGSNYSQKKKKKVQKVSKQYQSTLHSYNSTLNFTHGFQAMNSNGSSHNPNNFNLQIQHQNSQQPPHTNINNNNSNGNINHARSLNLVYNNTTSINNNQNNNLNHFNNNNNNMNNLNNIHAHNIIQYSQNANINQNNLLNLMINQQPTFQDLVKQSTQENQEQNSENYQQVYYNQASDQITKTDNFMFEQWFSIILDFDKYKYFKRYLPHNNVDKVLARFKFLEFKKMKSRLTNILKKGSQTNIKEKINLSQVFKQAERIRKQRRKLSLYATQQSQSESNLEKKHKRIKQIQSFTNEQQNELSKLKTFQLNLGVINTGEQKFKEFSKSEFQLRKDDPQDQDFKKNQTIQI